MIILCKGISPHDKNVTWYLDAHRRVFELHNDKYVEIRQPSRDAYKTESDFSLAVKKFNQFINYCKKVRVGAEKKFNDNTVMVNALGMLRAKAGESGEFKTIPVSEQYLQYYTDILFDHFKYTIIDSFLAEGLDQNGQQREWVVIVTTTGCPYFRHKLSTRFTNKRTGGKDKIKWAENVFTDPIVIRWRTLSKKGAIAVGDDRVVRFTGDGKTYIVRAFRNHGIYAIDEKDDVFKFEKKWIRVADVPDEVNRWIQEPPLTSQNILFEGKYYKLEGSEIYTWHRKAWEAVHSPPEELQMKMLTSVRPGETELTPMKNIGASCFVDSVLFALLASENEVVNEQILQKNVDGMDMSEAASNRGEACIGVSEDDRRLKMAFFQQMLVTFTRVIRSNRVVDLPGCENFYSALRKCDPNKAIQIRRGAIGDPADVLKSIFSLFVFDTLKTSEQLIYTDPLDQKDPPEIKNPVKITSAHPIILIYSSDLRHWQNQNRRPTLTDVIGIKTTPREMLTAGNYIRINDKEYRARTEIINNLYEIKAPFLVFQLAREGEVEYYEVQIPQTINVIQYKLKCSAIISYIKYNHYACYFLYKSKWYLFDDQDRRKIKYVGTWKEMLEHRQYEHRVEQTARLVFYTYKSNIKVSDQTAPREITFIPRDTCAKNLENIKSDEVLKFNNKQYLIEINPLMIHEIRRSKPVDFTDEAERDFFQAYLNVDGSALRDSFEFLKWSSILLDSVTDNEGETLNELLKNATTKEERVQIVKNFYAHTLIETLVEQNKVPLKQGSVFVLEKALAASLANFTQTDEHKLLDKLTDLIIKKRKLANYRESVVAGGNVIVVEKKDNYHFLMDLVNARRVALAQKSSHFLDDLINEQVADMILEQIEDLVLFYWFVQERHEDSWWTYPENYVELTSKELSNLIARFATIRIKWSDLKDEKAVRDTFQLPPFPVSDK